MGIKGLTALITEEGSSLNMPVVAGSSLRLDGLHPIDRALTFPVPRTSHPSLLNLARDPPSAL